MTTKPEKERKAPANIEAEQALLGAILINNAAFDRVASFLEPEHFFEQLHQNIFDVIAKTIRANKAATPITIKTFLPAEENVSGELTVAKYLALLAAEATTIVNAADYGHVIHDLWIRRQAINACDSIVSLAYELPVDGDILVEIAPIEDRLSELRAERVRVRSGKGIGQSYLDALSSAYQRREVLGVPIALAEISEVISEPCFEEGNLYGLLSSSGEGKTSLTVQLMLFALKMGHPVCFLSFDQSSDQVIRQMVAQEYEIEARRQRDAQLLSDKEFAICMEFATWIESMPFSVIKCSGQNAAQLVGMARTFTKRYACNKVPLIVVDHIKAVETIGRSNDPGSQASEKNRLFKSAAETLGSAWLVLNQRNTYGTQRDNPRPIASDLFGGEGARQDYDAIFYLYRYIKFLEERESIASSESDWKKIAKVFPADVRENRKDIAQIGAIKSRFGNPNIRRNLLFEARLTRYNSERTPDEQQTLGVF